eukprot:GHVS01052042.1.p1 GENE.GHVS01052042.1~~GHVS01052042.1.p1  ORF type:complete len:692 (+),score=43.20 GHVS01052042.1:89-2164(+)
MRFLYRARLFFLRPSRKSTNEAFLSPLGTVSSVAFCPEASPCSGEADGGSQRRLHGALLAGAVGLAMLAEQRKAKCCGIVGYIGHKDAEPILTEGVQILQNRGYDSCGITTVDDSGTMYTTKYASRGSTSDCIEILRHEAPKYHVGHHMGIAHTRWATHGSKTDANAHPHHDSRDRISLVHNGTIENYAVLKKRLLEQGVLFRTETDSEVIANLIGWYMDQGDYFENAVKRSIEELQGTWGLCIINKEQPDRIMLARNGSPLLVGTSEGQVFIASEASALARHTNQYLSLKDGEIAVITKEGIDQLVASRPLQKIHMEHVETTPAPFLHWTLKEIYEQPQSLARSLNYGGRISAFQNKVKLGGLDQNRESILQIRNLIIGGCGTSLYAGQYGELLMQWLGCFDAVRCVDASEIDMHTFPKNDCGMLLISQSGETLDTIRSCELAESQGIRKLSVVNVVGSLLARQTNCGVYCNAGREVAVASTKAFTSQVSVLALVAAWFAQNLHQDLYVDRCQLLMDAIHRIPVYAGMTLACIDKCKEIAMKIKDAKTVFVLGKGFGYPVAQEGALKIKEIGYIHAEGFAGGALKHGPFALIEEKEKTPVIMIVLSDQHAANMINAAQQVKARGAHLVCLTDDPSMVQDVADDIVVIPSNGPLTALLSTIPLQLIAYEIAVAKGINPDKPRGLAKTVTVS